MAELIWYAAYGSNLLEARFLRYLRGGRVPGSARVQHGARDAADPVEARPYRIDRPLGFGRSSRGWEGGGVCFVDPHRTEPEGTLGRAWLVTVEQLADVWAQENGDTVGPEVDVERLVVEGSADLGRASWYRRLELLGELDGRPVATITCDAMPDPNPAGDRYLEIVGRGVMETWSLSADAAARYLATRFGNHGRVEEPRLRRLLDRAGGTDT